MEHSWRDAEIWVVHLLYSSRLSLQWPWPARSPPLHIGHHSPQLKPPEESRASWQLLSTEFHTECGLQLVVSGRRWRHVMVLVHFVYHVEAAYDETFD